MFKRRKICGEYSALDIDPALNDAQPRDRWVRGNLPIPYEESDEWGPPPMASARALLQTEVRWDNWSMIRTYHPAFACLAKVLVCIQFRTDKTMMWVVFSTTVAIGYTHVAGLEVHLAPNERNYYRNPGLIPSRNNDFFGFAFNPRRLLSGTDLDNLRIMYPHACGFRVWLSGTIQMLYPTKKDLQNDRSRNLPESVGGYPLEFDVLHCSPSKYTIDHGYPVGASPDANASSSCLGLRLLLPDKTPVVTTVTHGFVRLPGEGILGRVTDLFWTVKDALLKFRTSSNPIFEHPHVRPETLPTSNIALGRDVWLHASNRKIGTIKSTFDSPSNMLPYPAGFSHDLSLISGVSDGELPFVDSPAGLPEITGWADISQALDGAPLFVSSTMARTGRRQTIHGEILDDATRKLLENNTEKAIAEGTQYLWDRDTFSQSVSLLWRTVEAPGEIVPEMPDSVQKNIRDVFRCVLGQSGSVLCMGRPTDAKTTALCFQNFQISCESGLVNEDGERASLAIKGGFFLPTFVYQNCTIDHSTCGERSQPNFATIPRAQRSSETERSFTAPH